MQVAEDVQKMLKINRLTRFKIVKNQDFLITISFIEVNLEALILTYAT